MRSDEASRPPPAVQVGWITDSVGPPATRSASAAPTFGVERRPAQLGAVPRHVRVVPLDPRQPRAVGADPRRRDEVGAGDEDDGFDRLTHVLPGRRRQRDDLVDRLGARCVPLPHAHQPRAVRAEVGVGVAQGSGLDRVRRDRLRDRLAGADVEAVDALVGPAPRTTAPRRVRSMRRRRTRAPGCGRSTPRAGRPAAPHRRPAGPAGCDRPRSDGPRTTRRRRPSTRSSLTDAAPSTMRAAVMADGHDPYGRAGGRSLMTEQIGDAAHALAEVVVTQRERQPEVPRRRERLAGDDRHLRLVEDDRGELQRRRHLVAAEVAAEHAGHVGERVEGALRLEAAHALDALEQVPHRPAAPLERLAHAGDVVEAAGQRGEGGPLRDVGDVRGEVRLQVGGRLDDVGRTDHPARPANRSWRRSWRRR